VLVISWIFVRATPFSVDRQFRIYQFVSASLYSLGHGGNDAQKTMGVIAVLLYSQGLLGDEFHVPLWVVLACQAAMALGTLFGGWRIVRTMGSRITRLTPMQGFCAETGGAATLFLATWLGVPVSTTIPSQARSSVSAPRGDCRQYAGTSPKASSSPGW
jgi:PiT family inorganic phosphate transporter